MTLEDLEKAFATVLAAIKSRDDGHRYLPIARKLEDAITAYRDDRSDLERYRAM